MRGVLDNWMPADILDLIEQYIMLQGRYGTTGPNPIEQGSSVVAITTTTIAYTNNEGGVSFWDPMSNTRQATLHISGIYARILLYLGNYRLAVAGAHTIYIYNLQYHHTEVILRGHSDVIMDMVQASPSVMVSAGFDCSIMIWQVATGQCVQCMINDEPISRLALLGKSILTGDIRGNIRKWDAGSAGSYTDLPIEHYHGIQSLIVCTHGIVVSADTVSTHIYCGTTGRPVVYSTPIPIDRVHTIVHLSNDSILMVGVNGYDIYHPYTGHVYFERYLDIVTYGTAVQPSTGQLVTNESGTVSGRYFVVDHTNQTGYGPCLSDTNAILQIPDGRLVVLGETLGVIY